MNKRFTLTAAVRFHIPGLKIIRRPEKILKAFGISKADALYNQANRSITLSNRADSLLFLHEVGHALAFDMGLMPHYFVVEHELLAWHIAFMIKFGGNLAKVDEYLQQYWISNQLMEISDALARLDDYQALYLSQGMKSDAERIERAKKRQWHPDLKKISRLSFENLWYLPLCKELTRLVKEGAKLGV
ncbi:MAG: hypothetical protein WC471_03315 [Candidatus Woesearchaeota archaeon]